MGNVVLVDQYYHSERGMFARIKDVTPWRPDDCLEIEFLDGKEKGKIHDFNICYLTAIPKELQNEPIEVIKLWASL